MPIEIERKFLLRELPSRQDLQRYAERILDIEQIYLDVSESLERRIRRTSQRSGTSFVLTHLWAQRPGVREVQEEQITGAAYAELARAADPRRTAVVKRRWRLRVAQRIFEIDQIQEPATRACLLAETELGAEGESVVIPDFLSVEREVTGNQLFSNAHIALG